MKRKLYLGIKVLVFAVLLCAVLIKCNDVLAVKEEDSRITSFYEEDKDSLEAVFIGSSHMFVTAYPFQLWEEYKIKSAVLGGNGMGVPMEYYCVKEAIREQHPDVIVVDLYKAYLDKEIDSKSFAHNMARAMPNTANKLRMLLDLIPKEDWVEFGFPLYLYHSRWKELTREDFEEQYCYTKGAAPQFRNYDASGFEEVSEEEKQEVPKTSWSYIEKMIEVCEENDVDLIFTVMPYETTKKTRHQQRVFNELSDRLSERGVEYYNFFHMMDEVGLDVKRDFYDDVHVNYEGGKKITSYLGKILSDKGLGAKNSHDSEWEEAAKTWHAQVNNKQITTINDKDRYLDFIDSKDYEFIIMIKDTSKFYRYFGQMAFLHGTKLPDGKCIYIYDDGKESVCPVDGRKIEALFNGKWLQTVNGDKTMMLDKDSYSFSEDVKIFVYDERLDQMIDVAGINYKEEKVRRK